MADEEGPTVFDASPLIFFARSAHIELLEVLPPPLLVPEVVANEIRRRGASDVTSRAIKSSEFQIAPTPPVPASVAQWGLGPGESAAISLALQHSGATVVIDDLAGRRGSSTRYKADR